MKKIYLSIALVLGLVCTVSAQEKMWVGGTAGVWSSKTTGGNSQLNFKVMPEIGYILNDNVALGVALGGAHTHGGLNFDGNLDAASSRSRNEYKVSPFLRYTFLKGDIGGLFVDGGGSYGWSKVTNGGVRGENFEVGFRPGIAFNVSSKLIVLSKFGFLGYQHDKKGSGDKASTTNSFGLDLDMNNLQFGFAYKF